MTTMTTSSTEIIRNPKYDAYYCRLRKKISDWLADKGISPNISKWVILAPDIFYLLCRLAVDSRVPLASQALLITAITYFISPIDIIPEAFLGPFGYLDDIAIAVLVLNKLLNGVPKHVLQEHWAGEGDILKLMQDFMAKADSLIGSGLWKKILGYFHEKVENKH